MTMFLDGNRVTPGTEGCQCGPECEMPCWQRIGLTTRPCCPGCAPLPADDLEPPMLPVTPLSERRGDSAGDSSGDAPEGLRRDEKGLGGAPEGGS